MAPGMPSYTKLSAANGANGGAPSGIYSVPPSPPPDTDKIRSSHTLFDMLSSDHSSSSSSSSADQSLQQHHFHQVMANHTSVTQVTSSLPLVPVPDPSAQHRLHVQPAPQSQYIPLPLVGNSHPSFFSQQHHLHQLQQQQQQQLQLQRKHDSLQERVNSILASPISSFNDQSSSDMKLTLISREGSLNVTVNVHTRILMASSRYFASKLSFTKQQQQQQVVVPGSPYSVEISDCEDVEIYLVTIRLMYATELKKVLLQENVPRVLAILKVASAIIFEAAITASLEYLEAVPWSEEDEENIYYLVSQLQTEYPSVSHTVLSRLVRPTRSLLALPPVQPRRNENDSQDQDQHLHPQDVMAKLITCVLRATDDKARREMKLLVSRLLHENNISASASATSNGSAVVDVTKESLYEACTACLTGLVQEFIRLSEQQGPSSTFSICREVDNLQWLIDILVDRSLAEDVVKLWSQESRLAELHRLVPPMQRYEISKITARLCIAIGKGHIMVPQTVRALLLTTWLQPLMDDFSWLHRSKSSIGTVLLDKRAVEEGLSCTILTLSLDEQKSVLMNWFERFGRDGDDCPNLQRAFEVWWRRTLRHVK